MSAIESLLNLKRFKEDEARQQFALMLRELEVEEKRLIGLEELYDETGRKFESAANELIEVSEIRKLNRFLESLLDKIQHQKEVIVLKERQVEESRKLLEEASKEKKTFEKLDEKQKDLLNKEIRRKEQIRTDENAVIRHARKRGDRR
ncbi:MAG: flagellar export protein FliJ [Nitrospirae bacterium]|nr:flagellar export protein FliJ [Nitrospirota bacterium]